MNNIWRIVLFQYIPSFINTQTEMLRKCLLQRDSRPPSIVENIDHFQSERRKTKSALISLSPASWLVAVKEYPDITNFNIVGLTFEMVKVLNENGYCVDIVDMNEEFHPRKHYDLFIGHGGRCRTIIDNLDPGTRILQYVSGAFFKLFNQESQERYDAFKARKNVKGNLTFRRSYIGLTEGEEYLTRRADVLFSINCPRMVDSYGDYRSKFYFTGLSAYLWKNLLVPHEERDFDAGRRNFIYVGGTGGNIQKGMDVLLEAFVRMPDVNLFIFCRVEREIFRHYKKELNAKNIHYIYHWRFEPFEQRLRTLVKQINFTLHAPINTGLGTAFLGSMGLGFVPVGYVDLIVPEETAVLAESWEIDSLIECVIRARNKSVEWCRNASAAMRMNYQERWSVEAFSNQFNRLILEMSKR